MGNQGKTSGRNPGNSQGKSQVKPREEISGKQLETKGNQDKAGLVPRGLGQPSEPWLGWLLEASGNHQGLG